jgi:hypothetical protein
MFHLVQTKVIDGGVDGWGDTRLETSIICSAVSKKDLVEQLSEANFEYLGEDVPNDVKFQIDGRYYPLHSQYVNCYLLKSDSMQEMSSAEWGDEINVYWGVTKA